jgi:NitT/TauT family transport system permease protein
VIVAGQPSIGVLFQSDQDQTDMPSTIAVMIVILILGVVVDAAFGAANRAIRKRWGLTQHLRSTETPGAYLLLT